MQSVLLVKYTITPGCLHCLPPDKKQQSVTFRGNLLKEFITRGCIYYGAYIFYNTQHHVCMCAADGVCAGARVIFYNDCNSV